MDTGPTCTRIDLGPAIGPRNRHRHRGKPTVPGTYDHAQAHPDRPILTGEVLRGHPMDPRSRADEALARSSARGAFVVTPDNAISPMDAASTVRIPREVVSGLSNGEDPNSTITLHRREHVGQQQPQQAAQQGMPYPGQFQQGQQSGQPHHTWQQTPPQQTGVQQANHQQTVWPTEDQSQSRGAQYYYPAEQQVTQQFPR